MRLSTKMQFNLFRRGGWPVYHRYGRSCALILRHVVTAVLIVIFADIGVSQAQNSGEMQALLNRLDLIQRDLNTLQRQFYRGEKPSSPPEGGDSAAAAVAGSEKAVALLTVRINTLEQELRKLTGQLEEVQFRMNSVTRRLDKLVEDIDFRLSGIEKRLEEGPVAAQTPPPAAAGADTTTPVTIGAKEGAEQSQPSAAVRTQPAIQPDLAPKVLGTIRPDDLNKLGQTAAKEKTASDTPAASAPAAPAASVAGEDPKQVYKAAFSILKKGDFPAAEQAFRDFLARYPDHELSANAQYWLGETFYVRKDYDNAAATFLQGYQKFPESAKGPDFLLKLGMSLRRSGSNEEACAAFAELSDKYPQMSASIRQRLRQESRAAKCS